ncbi:MAG: polymer-forming cytoskeletal protein [Candidatus Krumholzibacteriota bacterium]|nr:polymer-forming cytoskeletal protein [Candidatus Krumholzibacteriota bacterium]
MSMSRRSFARPRSLARLLLACLVLAPAAVLAQAADSVATAPDTTADSAPASPRVQEIIIDDSGIVVREGDREYQVGRDDDVRVRRSEGRVRTRVDTDGNEQVTFGENLTIGADEVLHNDQVILFGDLEIYGKIIGDIVVVMGDVNLYDGCEVTGDIVCVGGKVDVEPGADVFGEITPVSTGFSRFFGSDWRPFRRGIMPGPFPGFRGSVQNLLAMLILSWVGLLVLATRLPRLTGALRHHGMRSFFLGLLTLLIALLLAIPFVLLIVVLVLTFIGIPVAFLAVLAVIGLAFLGWLVPLYALSRYTFETHGVNRYLSVGIWAVVFWILHSLGGGVIFLIELFIFLLGIGALVQSRLGTREAAAA